MGRLLAGLAPELSLLVSERKNGVVSSSARWAGRPTSAAQWPTGQEAESGGDRDTLPTAYRSLPSEGLSCVCHLFPQ